MVAGAYQAAADAIPILANPHHHHNFRSSNRPMSMFETRDSQKHMKVQ